MSWRRQAGSVRSVSPIITSMPLSALVDGQLRGAWEFTPDEWTSLRDACRRTRVYPATTCCGQRASLKISARGTQFFAHIAREDCATGPETIAHIETKMAMVRGAVAAGWIARTEVRLDDGEAIADVLAEHDGHRVALEAQWSRITLADLEARQARYAALGVSGIWFVRHGAIAPSRALPAFALSFEAGASRVTLADRLYSVEAFTTLLLEGRVRYRTRCVAAGTVEVTARYLRGTCEACGERAHVASELTRGPVLSACGRELRPGASDNVGDDARVWLRTIAKPYVDSALHESGQPLLPPVLPHPPGKPFLGLVDGGGFCPQCGNGEVYRHRAVTEQVVVVDVPAPAVSMSLPHWCVDRGDGHCREP